MKLLILTQKVDKSDPVLGFFHRWLQEFAKRFESIVVICLGKGEYSLPSNVKVLSLGKEENVSKMTYLWRFYKYIWQERKSYEKVFVHMNQEYVILGYKHWLVLRKPIFLWRNHAKGGFWTRLAVVFSKKVFYTSPESYTARFKKAVKMPVGIDLNFFKPDPNVTRVHNSTLFLGRISPVKKVLEFVDWVKNTDYSATIAGPILAKDQEYGEKVKKSLTEKIKYVGPVTQDGALKLYQTHEIYVNKTPAGSFDKTILEAAACGMKLMVDNPVTDNLNIAEHGLVKLVDKLTQELR